MPGARQPGRGAHQTGARAIQREATDRCGLTTGTAALHPYAGLGQHHRPVRFFGPDTKTAAPDALEYQRHEYRPRIVEHLP